MHGYLWADSRTDAGKKRSESDMMANTDFLQRASTSESAFPVVVTLPRSTPSVRPLPRALYVYPTRFLETRDYL